MLPILTQSFWRDEAFSVLIAQKDIFDIIRLSTQDTSPPLYYILLHYWMILFGNSEAAVRFLSLIFHLFTVVIIFLIARKIIRSVFGSAFIALVTLFNPFLLQYAFEARTYSLLTFLSVAALYLIMLKRYVETGIVLALAIFAHNFAIISFAIFSIWWLFINKAKLQLSSSLRLTIFPSLVIFLWGSFILAQWSNLKHGFWIPKPALSDFLHSLEIFSSGEISYPLKSTLYLISKILLAGAGLIWIKEYNNKNNQLLVLIFALAFMPPFIIFLFSQFFTPLYYERYLILTVPMLILFTGYSLERLRSNFAIRFVLGGFVAIYITVLIIAGIQVVSQSTKPAVNSGVMQILSQAEKDDIIIPQNMLNFLETKFYVEESGKDIPVLAYSPDGKIPFYIGSILYDAQNIVREMPKNRRVWQIKSDGQYELLKL